MSEDSGMWVKVFPEYAGGGTPNAAVIGGATGAVTTSSFVGNGTNGDDGQAYDVYEFLGSGTLNVSEPGMVNALIVAGGGGGGGTGHHAGGAGGAGGVINRQSYLEKVDYIITVGGGGSAGSSSPTTNPGAKGGNSSLSDLIAYGGGGGSRGITQTSGGGNGNGGGSGGGMVSGHGNPGLATLNGLQGFDGNGYGGGGATSVAVSGSGGSPLTSQITGSPDEYGTGGLRNGAATSGYGDGAPNLQAGKNGILIVRLKVPTMSYSLRTNTTAPRTSHAARIEDGVVRQVIVIPHLDDDDAKITEYCNRIGLPGTWVDTSYTGSRRGKYAGVGDLFDPNLRNAEFVSPEASE